MAAAAASRVPVVDGSGAHRAHQSRISGGRRKEEGGRRRCKASSGKCRKAPHRDSASFLKTKLEESGVMGFMGFLVMLIVAFGTTMLAISAAKSILHLLFQFMDTAAVPQEIRDRR